jgi:hypothetical protein
MPCPLEMVHLPHFFKLLHPFWVNPDYLITLLIYICQVPNIKEQTFEKECKKLCNDFGNRMCGSKEATQKIGPTSDCKDNEKDCSCCCNPSCDETKRFTCEKVSETTTTEGMQICQLTRCWMMIRGARGPEVQGLCLYGSRDT